MDLEVKLFNPRRVVCEAVKITEENHQQVSIWVTSDQNTQSRIREETVWTLYEPLIQKGWR